MNDQFEALHLTVVELPVEIEGAKPVYNGYIRQLPFLAASRGSKADLYHELLKKYQQYRETLLPEEDENQWKNTMSVDQLLKYYDGELFADFPIESEQ